MHHATQVQELMFDYSDCSTKAPASLADVAGKGAMTKWAYNPSSRECTIQFTVPTTFTGPVFMYYRLTNFFQNHRKYVKSFDAPQLAGKAVESVNANCGPLDTNPTDEVVLVNGQNVTVPAKSALYYPCGLIANSFFSGEWASLLLRCAN
jgi:hypothetical protein